MRVATVHNHKGIKFSIAFHPNIPAKELPGMTGLSVLAILVSDNYIGIGLE